ncbi:hypothetical protein B7463_g1801, partial [Scytalidium lignicola]
MVSDPEKIEHSVGAVNAPAESVADEKLAATRDFDGAFAFLRNEADESIVDVDEKKLVRKIDWLVMPILFGIYVLQYIDKSLINYANVMGLTKDTGMTAADFSYLATFFYVAFAVFQPAHAYLMQRFPTAKYLAVNIILWGVMLAGLIVVRLFLGTFEAASAPCLILITGMWYKRAEQPLRVGIWYLGVGAGTIIGALASYGFQFYTEKTFKSWQIMFLIFGLITIAWGLLVYFILPDSPMTSHLTQNEKIYAIERLRENLTGIENKTFKMEQLKETMFDMKTWLIVVIIIAGNVPTGASGSYSSTLIKGFGYTSKESALLNIPSGAISMIAVMGASWFAGRFNSRGWGIVALLAPGVLGGGLMAFLPRHNKAGKLAGIYLTSIFGPNLAMMYSWAAANYAGHTKKVSINAIILFAYGASNIIGPLTFTGYTAPEYIPAKVAIMACLALAIVAAIILRYWYVWENKRRDRRAAAEGYVHVQDIEFMDLTDKQNPEFSSFLLLQRRDFRLGILISLLLQALPNTFALPNPATMSHVILRRTARPLRLLSSKIVSSTSCPSIPRFTIDQRTFATTTTTNNSIIPSYKVNEKRLWDTIHDTAKWGSTPDGGIRRLALTDTDKSVREWFISTVQSLGCTVKIDQMGNLFAIRPGTSSSLAPIGIGSHLDTQPAGGRYDGILGVQAGIEILKVLHENGHTTYAPLAVIDWTNEEGARFNTGMVSSGVWSGRYTLDFAHALPAAEDKTQQTTMRSELERIGFLGTVPASYKENPLSGHFELHIEQGPILEDEGKKIGVVTGVQSMGWLVITVHGENQHSGTCPMARRACALTSAARMISRVEEIALAAGGLSTVGVINSWPQSPATVPNKVVFTVDLSHHSTEVREGMISDVCAESARIAQENKCTVEVEDIWNSPAVQFHDDCIGCVREAARGTVGEENVKEMMSGAGHDSVHTSDKCPTSMFALGAQVLLNSVLRYDDKLKKRGTIP